MPSFVYKAIDPNGQSVNGVMEASDRRQAVQRLFAQNIKPISITQSDRAKIQTTDETIDFFKTGSKAKKRRLLPQMASKQKISLNFLGKLLELMNSGMPLGDAVKLLSVRLSDPQQKELANTLWKNLSEGRTLAATMNSMPDTFSASTAHLVEAGEATGNLVPILERIVSHMQETADLRSKVLNSLAYPAFICTVAFGVVLFFLFFLLPKIENMLNTLGGDMQFIAVLLIGGSNLAIKMGPFILIGLTILALGIMQWRKTPTGREKTDHWLLRIPFVGKIFLYSEIFQSSSLMATLMESGINTTETLRLAEKTLKNTLMRAKFSLCRQQIQEGASMASAFKQTHFMPDIAIDILTVGENTGNIVNSLREITKMNRRDLTRSLQIMTAVISSGALIFAFLLVIIIALSIIFSVFSISKSLTV